MSNSRLDDVLNTPIDETAESIRLAVIEKEFDVAYLNLVKSLVSELSPVFLHPQFESRILPGIVDTWFNEPHLKCLGDFKTAFLRWLEEHPPFLTRQELDINLTQDFPYSSFEGGKNLLKKLKAAENALVYSQIAGQFVKEFIDPNKFEEKFEFSQARQNLVSHLTDSRREYSEEDFLSLIAELKQKMATYLLDLRADIQYFDSVIKDAQSGKLVIDQAVEDLIESDAEQTLNNIMSFLKNFRDNKTNYLQSEVES